MICWKCNEAVGGPVCVGCGVVQPPRRDINPFEILGLKKRFKLTVQEVDGAWRELSRKVHPDRFAGRSAVERRMSLQWTASINDARKVLRDPRSRAHYLATGQAVPAEDRKIQLDPDFLEEMFDLQMEAKMDPVATRPRVEALSEALWSDLENRFARWEAGESNLDGVEEQLAKLRYVDNALAMTEPDANG